MLPKKDLESGYFFTLANKLYFVNVDYVFYINVNKQNQ